MSHSLITNDTPKSAVTLTIITPQTLESWLAKQSEAVQNWFAVNKFTGKEGSFVMIPGQDGKLSRVVASVHTPVSLWDIAALPSALPDGAYVLDGIKKVEDEEKLALGWLLGTHHFTLHKKHQAPKTTLCLSKKANTKAVERLADSIALSRDMITAPAEDMGPEEMAKAVAAVAKKHGAKMTQIVGDDLLKKNYPAIHTVGRGSHRAPRLIDLTWGNPKHPLVTLVGKGICFDTGGLDLKPSAAMYLMRKDKGGAAVALGVANFIMASKLKVRLRLLIAAAENAIDGKSFRPSDVITMRNGLTVEVGNTDAEGRLVLADALAEACTDKPDLLIDFGTLSGAYRASIGTDVSAVFSNNEAIADKLYALGQQTEDYLCRLPLHAPYNALLETPFADLRSCSNGSYGGTITSGLFLQHFVAKDVTWVHFDFMGFNVSSKPGRPEGGEAMTLRATVALLEKLYATK